MLTPRLRCALRVSAVDGCSAAGIRCSLRSQRLRGPFSHRLLLEGLGVRPSFSQRDSPDVGGFFCFPRGEKAGSSEYDRAKERPSPLDDAFDRPHFDFLFDEGAPRLSAKPFLATEQRIPGLGNGVLQDILWTARVHPKRKMGTLSDEELEALFGEVKNVLAAMTEQGGRGTERDLFGNPGGYRTVLSRHTVGKPCPACGSVIRKKAYLGGAIYTCLQFQRA
ncbi:TPA: endonuclease VIII [Candidatus Acetothermia bacterium]|nr:endonuclease VIII [Candidatus Acetothermia bacterium]